MTPSALTSIVIGLLLAGAEGADLNAHLLKVARVVGDQAGL